MSEQYRDIRKEVNLTSDELKQIEKMMEVDKYRHFSPFVRDKMILSIIMCKHSSRVEEC